MAEEKKLHRGWVKNAAIVLIPFHIGDQTFVAVIFQCLVGHVRFFAYLHHCVHGKNFLHKKITNLSEKNVKTY